MILSWPDAGPVRSALLHYKYWAASRGHFSGEVSGAGGTSHRHSKISYLITSVPQYLNTSYLLADLPYTLHIRSQLELITSIDLKVTGRDTAEL